MTISRSKINSRFAILSISNCLLQAFIQLLLIEESRFVSLRAERDRLNETIPDDEKSWIESKYDQIGPFCNLPLTGGFEVEYLPIEVIALDSVMVVRQNQNLYAIVQIEIIMASELRELSKGLSSTEKGVFTFPDSLLKCSQIY